MHLKKLLGVDSLNKLGERAGIASGPMSRLSRHTGEVAGSLDTIKKLTDAWGVRMAWLAYGRGGPLEDAPADTLDAPPGTAPEVIAAVRWARAAGYPETVVQRAYTGRRGGGRLTYEQCVQRLITWKAEHDAGILDAEEPTPPEDLPPGRRGRSKKDQPL